MASAAAAPRAQSARRLASVALDRLGLDVAELPAELADDLGYRKDLQGVVITRVQEGGLAAVADLRKGNVISKINDTPVTTAWHGPAVAGRNADPARGLLLQVATPQGGGQLRAA